MPKWVYIVIKVCVILPYAVIAGYRTWKLGRTAWKALEDSTLTPEETVLLIKLAKETHESYQDLYRAIKG